MAESPTSAAVPSERMDNPCTVTQKCAERLQDQDAMEKQSADEAAAATDASIQEAGSTSDPPMSKRKMKRMQKLQKIIEYKTERRKKEKEKKKEKRRDKLERGEDLGPSRKRLKDKTMKNSKCKVQVAIDCSFDDLMTERDVNHLVQQLQHCYSANRRAPEPLQLYVTSVAGKTLERLNAIGHFKNWDLNVEYRDYVEAFGQDNVVYLSSESPNVLETLADDKVYVIGGLVDHNHHKGLCHRLAEEKDIAHAQLPIGQYMDIKTRKVLTVNQVFEILMWFTETKSWSEAFYKAIPKRKGLTLKSPTDANSRAKEEDTDSEVGCPDVTVNASETNFCNSDCDRPRAAESEVSDRKCEAGRQEETVAAQNGDS